MQNKQKQIHHLNKTENNLKYTQTGFKETQIDAKQAQIDREDAKHLQGYVKLQKQNASLSERDVKWLV